MCLHDQQYAFRPGTGTLSPLQNLLAVVRQRTQANKATYACFFCAPEAYDSVPHALLLHPLLQCGVVGSVFAILVAMYSSASSRVRVGTALSPAFVVQRGVAKGCPLSPLLYAIFIDPVLQDMQSLSHPAMLWVGPATSQRKLVGQAYTEDLAGTAGNTTQHVTTSLSTGAGPVIYVQLSEGFQVVYPLGLWSRFSGVVKVRFGYG